MSYLYITTISVVLHYIRSREKQKVQTAFMLVPEVIRATLSRSQSKITLAPFQRKRHHPEIAQLIRNPQRLIGRHRIALYTPLGCFWGQSMSRKTFQSAPTLHNHAIHSDLLTGVPMSAVMLWSGTYRFQTAKCTTMQRIPSLARTTHFSALASSQYPKIRFSNFIQWTK